jgi:hypothetical protein
MDGRLMGAETALWAEQVGIFLHSLIPYQEIK